MENILSNLLDNETLDKLSSIIKNNQRMLNENILLVLKENGFTEEYFGMYAYRDVIRALLNYLVDNRNVTFEELVGMLLDFNSDFYLKIAPTSLDEENKIFIVADGNNFNPRAYVSLANAFIIEAVFAARDLTQDYNFRLDYKRHYLNLTLMITKFIANDLVSKEENINFDGRAKTLIKKPGE